MTEEDYGWFLLAKKVSGEATEKELNTFRGLLLKYPFLEHALHFISYRWRKPTESSNKEDIEIAFKRHLERMKRKL
jgi:hypothetical protein